MAPGLVIIDIPTEDISGLHWVLLGDVGYIEVASDATWKWCKP